MLASSAQECIRQYFNLPFKNVPGVRCPYFNNAARGRRAELRALVGKGTPQEIVNEAQIASIQYHAGLFDTSGNCCLHTGHGSNATADEIRRFLIDHSLGIECSGFVTHVLIAHYREKFKINLIKKLSICPPERWWRRLICRLRPIENISVAVYADPENTETVGSLGKGWHYDNWTPGDVIIMLGTGPNKKRNHILLITEKNGHTIRYVHARAWTNEGQYGHGVTEGSIILTNPDTGILEQEWREKEVVGPTNETWLEAQNAATLEVRRIKI